MTANDEIIQSLREYYKDKYGIFPNDDQFREFMLSEVKSALIYLWQKEQTDEVKSTD